MTGAHLLSLSRVVAGPVVAVLVLAPPGDSYLLASVLFTAAALTDLFDGQLARYSRNVSPFGIFLDTTSDKVLVSLTLIAMAMAGLIQGWVPLVIIGRDLLITGLRSYAASRDRIISAHIWGKGKAALTMAAVSLILAADNGRTGGALSHVMSRQTWHAVGIGASWLLGAAAALAIISGIRYVIDAWPLMYETSTGDVPRAMMRK